MIEHNALSCGDYSLFFGKKGNPSEGTLVLPRKFLLFICALTLEY